MESVLAEPKVKMHASMIVRFYNGNSLSDVMEVFEAHMGE
jgi:hypothetical protein